MSQNNPSRKIELSIPTWSDTLRIAANAAAVTGGAALALELFRHRRLLVFAGAVSAGVALAYHYAGQITGSPGTRSGATADLHSASLRGAGAPSFPHSDIAQSDQMPQDAIDEAAMESFPASDPPASYRRA